MEDIMIQFERARVNLWNVGGFLFLFASNIVIATGFFINTTRDIDDLSKRTVTKAEFTKIVDQVDALNEFRKARSAQTDANFQDLRRQIEPFTNLTYRVDQLEKLSTKIDAIGENVSNIKTDIRVLTQKIDNQAKPTGFTP